MTANAYRPELDGLRALAVLAVIVYHTGFDLLPGGFLGVDVFFVLSGYLITGIVWDGLAQSGFSLTHFYARRARRLLPALTLVCLATAGLGWLVMIPSDNLSLGESLLAVATFTANLYFANTTGYFERSVEYLPLLHTWSLAVEEQFYFVYPLLLLALYRLGRGLTLFVLCLLLIGSLLWAEYQSAHAPVHNFFLITGRAWELTLGAILALPFVAARLSAIDERYRTALGSGGIFLILASFVMLSDDVPLPGLATLPATLGAALVIACVHPAAGAGRVLSHPWAVAIGLSSYSAYLWHQPLFAFTQTLYFGAPPAGFVIGVAVGSLFLARLTTAWVENPCRRWQRTWLTDGRVVLMGFVLLSLIAVVGLRVMVSAGNELTRRSELLGEIANLGPSGNFGLGFQCEGVHRLPQDRGECVSAPDPDVILWGDSFAMHLAQGLQAAGVRFFQYTASACAPGLFHSPFLGGDYTLKWSQYCFSFNQALLDYLEINPNIKTIILAATFRQYAFEKFFHPDAGAFSPTDDERVASLRDTIDVLKARGLRVVLVVPPPQAPFDLGRCAYAYFQKRSGESGEGGESGGTTDSGDACGFDYQASTPAIAFVRRFAATEGIPVIDLPTALCPDGRCQTIIDGVPMFVDHQHLSPAGSELLARRFGIFDLIRE